MKGITEKEFQQQVIDLAHYKGWHVLHIRPAMNRDGSWVTAISADGKGYPDLTLVRERVIWTEIKVVGGKMTPEQVEWCQWLAIAEQEVYLWDERDWDEIKRALE